jgi:hypothetical protein
MLSDFEYQLLIYENVRYIYENIQFEDIKKIDDHFRSEFLGDPFPRDIILEYVKYICVKLDRNNFCNKNNIIYIIIVIYNLLIKYYVDVLIANIDLCTYFKLELTKFNEIEIIILELIDYNFNCIDVTKWIQI